MKFTTSALSAIQIIAITADLNAFAPDLNLVSSPAAVTIENP
jgi:hypothetical protein